MPKVAVITRHAIVNYGSLLQAIATQQAVESCGCSCEIIDYIREDEHYKNIEKTMLALKPEWNGSTVKRAVYLAARQPFYLISGRRFEKMRNKYLNMSRRYSSEIELADNPPEADIYMTGSDQVWGPVAGDVYDGSYFLNFVSRDKIKTAYAASFGRTELDAKAKEQMKQWLSEYDTVTVRESSAADILDEMGISAEHVLDPTLLLTPEQWSGLIEKEPDKKYVLVYQIHKNKELDEYAKSFAKKAGLPLIRISSMFHQKFRGGKFIFSPDISTFLAYIKNASCLITDSFHGTAFALNFGTQFIEVLPNNKTHTRNQSILDMTGLGGRILKNQEDFSFLENNIDYGPVKSIIETERKKSMERLRQMLNKNLENTGGES